MIQFISHSVEETEQFAQQFAARLHAGDVIACSGGLGMGKTAFARGLARGLGLRDEVSSPTFALVHEYTQGTLPLYHFDMYRIADVYDLESTGFYDYLERDGVLFIEWSEQIAPALDCMNPIRLTIACVDENTREITIEGAEY